MGTINTVFQPKTPTILVGVTAIQPATDNQLDAPGVRVRCLVTGYLSWGPKSNITALGAPANNAPVMNTMGMFAGTTETFEIPANFFFISSVAAGFEITGGTGA